MNHTYIQEKCCNCSPDSECFCNANHVCINCVNRFCDEGTYKSIEVYCTQCKKIVRCWFDKF
jgi:hypothetical protein